MANTIKKGESLFIPFKNGESIYDSQLKPRMYKTKEQYDRFSYRFDDAEMVEYTEVVRCKECEYWFAEELVRCEMLHAEPYGWCCRKRSIIETDRTDITRHDDFCSYGVRKDNE